MANPYAEIFKIPGVIAFSTAGFLARFPVSMNSFSIITMISSTRSSGFAGLVATTYIIASTCISPQVSRLADRYGQSRIVLPFSFIAVAAIAVLIAAFHYHAPDWILFAAAAFMGCMPSFGALVRARWVRLCGGTTQLQSAFALESIIDETIFMIGPVVVVYLATLLFPEAGLVAAALLLLSGSFAFYLQKRTEPAIILLRDKGGSPVIFMPEIQILVLTLLAVGGIFGTAEVIALAIAKQQGIPASAGYALSAYAFGSFLAGICYGGRIIRMELSRQFVLAIALAALTILPLLFVQNIWQVTIVLFIAGAACSPTIIIAMRLVERVAPKEKMTEGITWASTGISVGVALGLALSGQLIDYFPQAPQKGFIISVVAGLLALCTILLWRKKLEPRG